MLEVIRLLSSFWGRILDILNNAYIPYGDVRVSIGGLIFAFLVVGMVITIFWKGSRS